MHVAYSGEALSFDRPSLFLAGPTPRRPEVPSWRPEALDLLRTLGFSGTVLVPEWRDGAARVDYLDQVEWEHAGLTGCTVIAFWVPRDLVTLPGFTTNVEFGRFADSGRCVYGRPPGAPKTAYLDWLYTKATGRRPEDTLEATMRAAVVLAQGATRG